MKFNARVIPWSQPLHDLLNLNADGAAGGESEPIGIGRVLRNDMGDILCMLSKSVSVYG